VPARAGGWAAFSDAVEDVYLAAAALCAAVDPGLIVVGGPPGSVPAVADAVAAALRSRWPHDLRGRRETTRTLTPA
jgi:predicted NBD/HSP70 family sugar kinase